MESTNYRKIISVSALLALTGFILSGPAGFLLVRLSIPQPQWVSPEVFASHYHVIQDLPFYFGFLLVGGMMTLIAAHYLQSGNENPTTRFYLLMSVTLATIFSALILFNYVGQIIFVRNLALHYKPQYAAAIEMFSMANPLSFCWANEMFGYGILGIATGFLSAYYHDKSNFIRTLLIVNCAMSLLSVAWTIGDANWVLTTTGLVAYFAWNLLMIVTMVAVYRYARHTMLYETKVEASGFIPLIP